MQQAEIEKIQQCMASMSLEEKVGQLFIVRCPREQALEDVAKYHLGGYTLYAVDFDGKTPADVQNTLREYQNAAKIPLFIAVDEEGGGVVRASKFPAFREKPFASPAQVYAEGGLEALHTDTREKCRFLRRLGINVNYAPVCDLSLDPTRYIYARTLGLPAAKTAEGIAAITEEMVSEHFGCSLKHFPGYGDNVDTHTGMATDSTRTLADFEQADYLPFLAGIRAGAGMIMVAHILIHCMDRSMPASLSPAVHRILREDLHFDGVIVTDSLDMGAITDFTGGSEAAVTALKAGNDLLCCSSYRVQYPALLEAVRSGEISEARIDASLFRILSLKHTLGLL